MTSPTPGLQAVYPLPPPGHPAGSAEPNQQSGFWPIGAEIQGRGNSGLAQNFPARPASSFRFPPEASSRRGRELPPLPPCPLTKGFGDISWTRAASVLQRGKSKERVSSQRGHPWPGGPPPLGRLGHQEGLSNAPSAKGKPPPPPPKKRPSESTPVPAFLSHCVWT